MKQTENFFLKLFEGTDNFDYKVVNENWQKIDDAIDELLNGGNIAVLPTMTIEKVDGGYRITTSDAKGSHSFEIFNGKTAYEYAQDGGYTGTEEEFAANVALGGSVGKELAVQSARIDKFVALEEGSTTGDAELMDIRVGADAVIYETAGEAVRRQVGCLSENIDDLVRYHYREETATGTDIDIYRDRKGGVVITANVPTSITHIGKNMLVYPYDYYFDDSKPYGILYTDNGDGSVHVVGTATQKSICDFVPSLMSKRKPIKKGTYTFSGCPSGGSYSTYRIVIGITGIGEVYDHGEGVTFTIEEDTTYYAYFTVYPGTTVDFEIKPQLELYDSKTKWEAYTEEIIEYTNGKVNVTLFNGVNHFISDTSFSITRYVERESENVILSIKDFGAVGDGVTDDTNAINNALTQAMNKVLYVPEGVYLFSGTLYVHSGTKIIGCGERSVFQLANDFTLDDVVWRTDSGANAAKKYPMILFDEDSDGCILSNFTLIGSTTTWKDENEDGIMVRGSNHILENLVIHDINYSNEKFSGRWCLCPAWGINIFKASVVSVRNCHVYDCGYENIGTEEAETVTISDCKFGDACQTSSQIHRYSKHIKFYGNTVYHTENIRYKDCPAFTMDASIGVDMDDIIVANNTFGCHVNTVAGGENNIKIIGNHIDGIMYTNTTENYAQGLMICNNHINGRINMRADKVIVSNNIINNDTEMPMVRIYGNFVEMNSNLGVGLGKSTTTVEH